MKITVAVVTARKDPRLKEMIESLAANIQPYTSKPNYEFLLVDEGLWEGYWGDGTRRDPKTRRQELLDIVARRFPVVHVPPKPTLWRGPYRATKRDYWAKASAVNTALLYARGERVAFADDCTVFAQGWLVAHAGFVGRAVAGGYKYLEPGAKVTGCDVDGIVSSNDHRLEERVMPEPCPGGWLCGGNFSVPLEVALRCGGLDELMDGAMGLEDCEFGLRVSRVCQCYFVPQCIVYQLTETHEPLGGQTGLAPAEARGEAPKGDGTKLFKYRDPEGVIHNMTYNHSPIWRLTGHRPKRIPGTDFWKPEHDPALDREKTRFTPLGNTFELRRLREHVQQGGEIPIPRKPLVDWRDGQRLEDM